MAVDWGAGLTQGLANVLGNSDRLFDRYLALEDREAAQKAAEAAAAQKAARDEWYKRITGEALKKFDITKTPMYQIGSQNKSYVPLGDNFAAPLDLPQERERTSEGNPFQSLVKNVIKQESAGNPNAVSYTGAVGLMQLMPETARDLGLEVPDELITLQKRAKQLRRQKDPGESAAWEKLVQRTHELKEQDERWDPQLNQSGGTKYLRQMLERFGGNPELALAAYNSGPGNVEKAGGAIPNIKETQDYVSKIMANMASEGAQMSTPSSGPQSQALDMYGEIMGGGYESVGPNQVTNAEQAKRFLLQSVDSPEKLAMLEPMLKQLDVLTKASNTRGEQFRKMKLEKQKMWKEAASKIYNADLEAFKQQRMDKRKRFSDNRADNRARAAQNRADQRQERLFIKDQITSIEKEINQLEKIRRDWVKWGHKDEDEFLDSYPEFFEDAGGWLSGKEFVGSKVKSKIDGLQSARRKLRRQLNQLSGLPEVEKQYPKDDETEQFFE